MHVTHRSRALSPGRKHRPLQGLHRRATRGFSITELSVALAFFAIFAAGVTAVLGAAVTSRVSVVQEADLVASVSDLADRVAAQPYEVLLADTFTVPEPCTPGLDTGSTATSCVTVRQTTYPITWTITPVAATATEVALVRITAAVTVDRGATRTLERTVPAPIDGFTPGEAVIRVTALESASTLTGRTVYLLDAAETVVDSAAFTSTGIALLSTDAAACPTPAPCAVSLSATGWGRADGDGTVLTGPAARGNLVTVTDTLATAVVGVGEAAQLRVGLLARNASGQSAPASDPGSVCLWVRVDDDGGRHLFPACNTADAGALTITDYPTGANATARMALTRDAQVRLSVDHPNGTCPRITGADAPGVCTSWTWGTPDAQWTATGSAAFGTPITLVTELTPLAVLWQGANARPAAGYPDEPVWAFPRDPAAITPEGCAATGTCTPVTTPPEVAACPGEHCRSVATPVPTLTWDGSVALTIPSSAAVTADVVTSGDDTATLTLLTGPTTGTLAVIENGDPRVLAASDTIATGVSPAPTLRYTPAAATTTESFVVRVTSGSATRDVRLYLVTDTTIPAHAYALLGEPYWANNIAHPVSLLSLDTLGNPVAATISLTYGTSATGAATAATTSFGWGSVDVTPSAAGERTFTTSAGTLDPARTHTVTALAVPAFLEVSAPASAAIGSIPVTVAARDSAGDPLAGARVTFIASAAGANPQATWSPASCITNAGGSCTVSLVATVADSLTVRVVSSPLADSTTVAVTP